VQAAIQLVVLLAVAATVAGVSGRIGFSSPLVLTVAGLVLSFLPGMPDYQLEPELVLVGMLPPLLYATAIRTPFVNIRRHRRAITLLSVALVGVSALAVGVAARLVLGPQLPWGAAIALGAVVAPPDAVAATAVARRIGMPRTLVTLLEGESLLNDATALVTLRSALAALGVGVSFGTVTLTFVEAVLVGAGAGWAVAAVATPIRRRVHDPVLDTTVSLLVPYVGYLLAEELHGSGVLGVVVAGLILGHRSPEIQSAASRATERTIWRTVQFLLESVIFLLIGLQLRRLVEDARASQIAGQRIVVLCLAVFAAAVLVRLVWVFPAAYLPRLVPRIAAAGPGPRWPAVLVLGWSGMRGVVTLAAALGLPAAVPAKEALVIAAFSVVAGTLLLQGSTLPALVRRLGLTGLDPRQDALQQALVLQRAVDAGRERLHAEAASTDPRTGRPAPSDVVESLSGWGERIAHSVWERLAMSDPGAETPSRAFRRLRVAMLDAERRVVVDVHRSGAVPAEVLEGVLERLDSEEAMLGAFADGAATGADTPLRLPPGKSDTCEHLRTEPLIAVPDHPGGCPDCLALGQDTWVALRMCVHCGHVGCCDSSPNRHAYAHHRATGHPVMRSIELGEEWRWCYLDTLLG
jgi:CPA1 family monovalent cation:H+ antiporter